MDWAEIRRGASRLADQAREAWQETSENVKEATRNARESVSRGFENASNWMDGEDEPRALPPRPDEQARARPSAPAKGPVWTPPVNKPPPKIEELRKGTKVYRKGALAEVVKVDYEADPPSLVVRMLEGGNEVGTDAAHVSLGPELSACHFAMGVRAVIVELQGRKELNGCRGAILEFKPDVGRWNIKLDSGEVVSVKPRNLSVLLRNSAEAVPPAQTASAPSSAPAGQAAADSTRCASSPSRPMPSMSPPTSMVGAASSPSPGSGAAFLASAPSDGATIASSTPPRPCTKADDLRPQDPLPSTPGESSPEPIVGSELEVEVCSQDVTRPSPLPEPATVPTEGQAAAPPTSAEATQQQQMTPSPATGGYTASSMPATAAAPPPAVHARPASGAPATEGEMHIE